MYPSCGLDVIKRRINRKFINSLQQLFFTSTEKDIHFKSYVWIYSHVSQLPSLLKKQFMVRIIIFHLALWKTWIKTSILFKIKDSKLTEIKELLFYQTCLVVVYVKKKSHSRSKCLVSHFKFCNYFNNFPKMQHWQTDKAASLCILLCIKNMVLQPISVTIQVVIFMDRYMILSQKFK